jgi:hypothetical protein
MKEQITKFECDSCGKEIIQGNFPYDKKWFYLYNLELKNSDKGAISFKDKHFCSLKCMKTFIDNKLNEISKTQEALI